MGEEQKLVWVCAGMLDQRRPADGLAKQKIKKPIAPKGLFRSRGIHEKHLLPIRVARLVILSDAYEF